MSPLRLLPLCALAILLAACGTNNASPTPIAQAPTITPTRTASPTATHTLTVTPTATKTIIPTSTRRPTNTRTAIATPSPTFMPTFPPTTPLGDNSRYRLGQWSAERADGVVQLMEKYSKDNSETPIGFERDYRASSYLADLRQESLLRFRNDLRADTWRRELVYNLALTGGNAEKVLTDFIEKTLNSSQTDLDDLGEWLDQHGWYWGLEINPLHEVNSLRQRYTITASTFPDYIGGVCLLVSQEKSTYTVLAIKSKFNITILDSHIVCEGQDVTHDGTDEVIFSAYSCGHNFCYGQIKIYDVSAKVVLPLLFEHSQTSQFGVLGFDEAQSDAIIIERWIGNCGINLQISYQWNGEWLAHSTTGFFPSEAPSLIGTCLQSLDQIATQTGLTTTINLLTASLNSPDPDIDVVLPVDNDELRYRLGLYQALAGQPISATATFTDLISNPTVVTSTWVAPAQAFLNLYQSPTDLYSACAQATLCNPRFAIEQLAQTLPPAALPLAMEQLRGWGVPVLASGSFDFDNDTSPETWFTTRHQNQTELWVLARTPNSLKALFVTNTAISRPTLTRLQNPDDQRALIQVGSDTVLFGRLSSTDEPYLTVLEPQPKSTTTIAETIQQAKNDLFNGANPALIRDVLLHAQTAPDFDCDKLDCAEFTYLLGLTYELTGAEREAVDTYLELWRTYPDSPFTIMARAKLEEIP